MQSASRAFGPVYRGSSSILRAYPVASSSRVIQVQGHRHVSWLPNVKALGSPVNWVRNKIQPKTRESASKEDVQAARQAQAAKGETSLLEAVEEPIQRVASDPTQQKTRTPREKATSHKYSTANFKISHRKLNDLGRQIANKPVDYALLQMQFSEKRASQRVKVMLATAKRHAVAYKKLKSDKLVVAEAWVTKGPRSHKRVDIKGRGRTGIKVHPDSRLHVVLKEGATWEERAVAERAYKLSRIRSAGLVKENIPLRNPSPMWAW